MQLYPAIDIKSGQCVRLSQGKFDDVTVFEDDPVKAAGRWVNSGATYLHIVDLDGARYGKSFINDILAKIISAYGVPVQIGGGIRTMRDVEDKINIGVSRVVLGTAAIKNLEFVKEAVAVYGEKIAVGIDASNGMVAIEGWEQVSGTSALSLCLRCKDIGVKTVVYTDISKDGMMKGPNISSTKELIDAVGFDIIASGGVSGLKDLEDIKAINAAGVIIGKALYKGTINLKEAIQLFEGCE